MGFSRSPAELAGKTGALAVAVAGTPRKATRIAGESAAALIRGVSPSVLRNVGRRGGAKLGVRVNVLGESTSAIGRVYATGPWQIIEYDTKPHPIPRLRGARGKKFGPAFGGVNTKRLALPNGGVRASVWHPGTKGQLPFHKGAALARPVIPKVYEAALVGSMSALF